MEDLSRVNKKDSKRKQYDEKDDVQTNPSKRFTLRPTEGASPPPVTAAHLVGRFWSPVPENEASTSTQHQNLSSSGEIHTSGSYRGPEQQPHGESSSAILLSNTEMIRLYYDNYFKGIEEDRELNEAFQRIEQMMGQIPPVDHVGSSGASTSQAEAFSSSSYKDEGKKHATDEHRVEHLEQQPDIPQTPELTIRLYQDVTDIFIENLDQIDNPDEKDAYREVLRRYAHVLHDKAKETFQEDPACQNILQKYEGSPIYYKWYGSGIKKGPTKLIARRLRDSQTNEVMIIIAPSQGSLMQIQKSSRESNPRLAPDLDQPLSMRDVRQHLQEERPVLWSTPRVLRPFHKRDEVYEGKQGPEGLYITNNHTMLMREFGGLSSDANALYRASVPGKVVADKVVSGPWILPAGAIKVDSSGKREKKKQK